MQPQVTAISAEHLMVDRAFMLNLSVPQMAALLGSMRAMGINVDTAPRASSPTGLGS